MHLIFSKRDGKKRTHFCHFMILYLVFADKHFRVMLCIFNGTTSIMFAAPLSCLWPSFVGECENYWFKCANSCNSDSKWNRLAMPNSFFFLNSADSTVVYLIYGLHLQNSEQFRSLDSSKDLWTPILNRDLARQKISCFCRNWWKNAFVLVWIWNWFWTVLRREIYDSAKHWWAFNDLIELSVHASFIHKNISKEKIVRDGTECIGDAHRVASKIQASWWASMTRLHTFRPEFKSEARK